MTEQEIYDLYVLQSKNVRALKQAENILRKNINADLKRTDSIHEVSLKTKLYALLYCTLSEAQFIQIIYTPNGFQYSEIEKIKAAKKKDGISYGWFLMIDLALQKVGDLSKEKDLQARQKKLHDIVKEYIEKPSLLRNKVAHGQWDYALNRENTSENKDLTLELANLDIVKISIWSEVHQILGELVRDLVQSPQKGFHNNYWVNMTNLDTFLAKSSKWTVAKRIIELSKRKITRVSKEKNRALLR